MVRGARRIAAGVSLLLGVLFTVSPAAALAAGDVVFRVYLRGTDIGSSSVSLAQDDAGWHITSSAQLAEPFQLSLRQLEMHYDAAWRPLRMTMEQVSPDDSAVVHVAFGLADGTTRTDIVRPGQALWGANKVSPDTIPLPDYVFAAYTALAARLTNATVGMELRVFVVPRFEAVLRLDSVDDQTLRTTSGTVAIKRWRATLQRPEGATPMHLWVSGGQMYRLDLPKEELLVIREDVLERR